MRFAVIFFLGSIFVSDFLFSENVFLFVFFATVLGFVLGKVLDLQKELKALKEVLERNYERKSFIEKQPEQPLKYQYLSKLAPEKSTVLAQTLPPEPSLPLDSPLLETSTKAVKNLWRNKSESSSKSASSVKNSYFSENTLFNKTKELIKSYFTGGNLFVRIGILILFFGISFLLKYVSEQGLFPIEYRLSGVALGAMALLGLGWRLRESHKTYALLLQGAGIGILYLTIYAAFALYPLLPPMAAFVLLFVVSMFSAALAVMQDSKSLAVLGFSGGFLAPVLASSGSNNHIALFSYYGVLNLAIVAVAWFKAWRPLNLLGFVFTFIIGTAWGVAGYNSEKFSSTEPFLIVFFLFYVLIAVLFALRQPPKLRGYVDGTLLFGVPLAASGLQYLLVKDFDYGVSLSFFVMGAFYLLLSGFIWKRKGDDLKLLAEAFLMLGIIFASMAIPFALAPTQTAAAWALEGAGLLWLGTRQNRLSVRAFGLMLQFGAGGIFLSRYNLYLAETQAVMPFVNGEFIGCMMLAIAGILSARLLIKPFEGRKYQEERMSPILLGWGLMWLFGGFIFQLVSHYSLDWFSSSLLLFTALTSLLFMLFALRFTPPWKHAWTVASGLFILILLLALLQAFLTVWDTSYHPLQKLGWIAWPVVFGVYYFGLKKREQYQVLPSVQPIFHTALLCLLVLQITLEGAWFLELIVENNAIYNTDWVAIWYVIPAMLALWLIIKAKFWPFSTNKDVYFQHTGVVLSWVMSLWLMMALSSAGNPAPLAWIPLFNPLDIVSIMVVMCLFTWWKILNENFSFMATSREGRQWMPNKMVIVGLAGFVFIWLNVTLFRMAHHWFGVIYQVDAMYQSDLVQTAISILWALLGVLITVYASRKKIRFLWLVGAALLGVVVLKLFVIDLSTLDNLSRIISFMVVGVLLMSIGYFAPLPEKTLDVESEHKESKSQESKNKENNKADKHV